MYLNPNIPIPSLPKKKKEVKKGEEKGWGRGELGRRLLFPEHRDVKKKDSYSTITYTLLEKGEPKRKRTLYPLPLVPEGKEKKNNPKRGEESFPFSPISSKKGPGEKMRRVLFLVALGGGRTKGE